jgi:hypothetical protein
LLRAPAAYDLSRCVPDIGGWFYECQEAGVSSVPITRLRRRLLCDTLLTINVLNAIVPWASRRCTQRRSLHNSHYTRRNRHFIFRFDSGGVTPFPGGSNGFGRTRHYGSSGDFLDSEAWAGGLKSSNAGGESLTHERSPARGQTIYGESATGGGIAETYFLSLKSSGGSVNCALGLFTDRSPDGPMWEFRGSTYGCRRKRFSLNRSRYVNACCTVVD